jgi:diaminopimelate epimerase
VRERIVVKSPVRVVTQGGEELAVHFRRRGGEFGEVYLEGSAAVAFEGKTWDDGPPSRPARKR